MFGPTDRKTSVLKTVHVGQFNKNSFFTGQSKRNDLQSEKIAELVMQRAVSNNQTIPPDVIKIFLNIIISCLNKHAIKQDIPKEAQNKIAVGLAEAIKPFINAFAPTYYEKPLVQLQIKSACEFRLIQALKICELKKIFPLFKTEVPSDEQEKVKEDSISKIVDNSTGENCIKQMAETQKQLEENNSQEIDIQHKSDYLAFYNK